MTLSPATPAPEALPADAPAHSLPSPAPARADLPEQSSWFARGTLADRICLGGIAVHLTVRLVAGFFTAFLLARPLLHLALVGSISALVTGGVLARVGRISLVAVICTGLVGLVAFDAFYWWAGRRYEHRISADLVKLSGLPAPRIAQAEALMGRHGFWILVVRFFQPIPNLVLQVLAGAGGMSLRRYLLGSFLGAALWMGLLTGLGWAVGHPAVKVIDAITSNALKVTLALVVVSVLWSMVKSRRAAVSPAPEEEPAPSAPAPEVLTPPR